MEGEKKARLGIVVVVKGKQIKLQSVSEELLSDRLSEKYLCVCVCVY